MAFSFFRPCGPSFLKLFSAVAFLRPWFFRLSWAICFHSILDCVASPMPSLASPLEKILVGRDEFSVVVNFWGMMNFRCVYVLGDEFWVCEFSV